MHSAGLSDQANLLTKELALEDLARLDELKQRAGWSISMDGLSDLSVLRQKNLLRHWSEIKDLPAPSSKIINEILSSVVAARQDASPEVIWQTQYWARFQNRLYLLRYQNKTTQQDQPIHWDMQNSLVLTDDSRVEARRAKGRGLAVGAESVEIRYRQGGERCKPQGRGRSSSLKKLLLEYQLPPWLRDRVPLFYVRDQLVAVGDLWVCEGWSAKPKESGMEIHWQVDSV